MPANLCFSSDEQNSFKNPNQNPTTKLFESLNQFLCKMIHCIEFEAAPAGQNGVNASKTSIAAFKFFHKSTIY